MINQWISWYSVLRTQVSPIRAAKKDRKVPQGEDIFGSCRASFFAHVAQTCRSNRSISFHIVFKFPAKRRPPDLSKKLGPSCKRKFLFGKLRTPWLDMVSMAWFKGKSEETIYRCSCEIWGFLVPMFPCNPLMLWVLSKEYGVPVVHFPSSVEQIRKSNRLRNWMAGTPTWKGSYPASASSMTGFTTFPRIGLMDNLLIFFKHIYWKTPMLCLMANTIFVQNQVFPPLVLEHHPEGSKAEVPQLCSSPFLMVVSHLNRPLKQGFFRSHGETPEDYRRVRRSAWLRTSKLRSAMSRTVAATSLTVAWNFALGNI